MRNSAAASGSRSTSQVIFPSQLLPPEPGLVADAGVAVPAFLCIFLGVPVAEGAIVFAPEAPETVPAAPSALGLLIPVPPCPPAALCAQTLAEILASKAENRISFVATRISVSLV